MKDSEARAVINLLNKRICQLDEILLAIPHPSDCKCPKCNPHVPDHFARKLSLRLQSGSGFDWFEDV